MQSRPGAIPQRAVFAGMAAGVGPLRALPRGRAHSIFRCAYSGTQNPAAAMAAAAGSVGKPRLECTPAEARVTRAYRGALSLAQPRKLSSRLSRLKGARPG